MSELSAHHQPITGNQCHDIVRDNSGGGAKPNEDDHPKNTELWRPWSLQKRTIYLFMAAFGLLAIALETLFIISEKHQGLATAFSSATLHYSWTYGPTVVVSSMSAVWVCVHYSAKASAPWIRIRNAKNKMDVDRTLLLDYISPFSILIPFRATKNRDFLVAATTLISMILTIMVIFSSSLIRLVPVNVSVPVQPLNKFANNPSRLDIDDYGRVSMYNVIGLKRFNLTH